MHVPKTNHLVPMPMARGKKCILHKLLTFHVLSREGHSVERGKPMKGKYFLGSKVEEKSNMEEAFKHTTLFKSLANSIIPYMDHAFIAFLF